jgi:hypothetical protein
MPTLHLPAAHTDTDVALATELAHVVGSQDLYVAWSHGEGPGLAPEVQREAPALDQPTLTPLAEVLVAMVQGLSAIWNAILHPPSTRAELPAPREERRTRRSAAAEDPA